MFKSLSSSVIFKGRKKNYLVPTLTLCGSYFCSGAVVLQLISMAGIFLDLNRKYHLGPHHLKPHMNNFTLRVDLYEKRVNRQVHGHGDSGAVWVRA